MRLRLFKPFLIVLLSLVLIAPALTAALPDTANPEENRARLLSYVLRQQLTQHHFSHKPVDDELSEAAFDLYLKQLDFQKRFLLQEDVTRLEEFSDRIDDEINQGKIELPLVAAGIMQERVRQVRQMTEEILAKDLDLSRDETLETDPEKLAWCKSREELAERWRKILKFQVINTMLILEDEEKKETGGDQASTLQARSREKVAKRFEHFFERLLKDTPRDHYDRYFNALTRAFDPHTTYFPPQQKEDFEIGMRGSLEGIGATLREDDGFIKVVRIIPGSAAARQGDLHEEDIILAVGQGKDEPVDVTDTRLRDAVELIRGPKGSEVRLTVKKADGSHKVIAIVRDVVEIEETFVKWTVIPDPESGKNFGYIRIPSFYRDFKSPFHGGSGRNVTDDVAEALAELRKKKISGLVLDLRNNGGGALTDAVQVSGLFIDKGPVVQVKNSNGQVQVLEDRDAGTSYSGPLTVLVNQFSASASEILAAALQDYHRATILGSAHTYGKGTVQTILDLDRSVPLREMDRYKPLGALKITTQKFYRVSGGSTQAKGVEPDLVIPDRMQHIQSGEKYIDYSLPWDTVPPSHYQTWETTPEVGLDQVRAASNLRIEGNSEFRDIIQEAQKAQERSDQTLVSLNLEKARAERLANLNQDDAASPLHGGFDVEDHPDQDQAGSEKEKQRQWEEQVRKDPYTLEAVSVLNDLISSPTIRTTGTSSTADVPKSAN